MLFLSPGKAAGEAVTASYCILTMVHAFPRGDSRREDVRRLARAVASLEAVAEMARKVTMTANACPTGGEEVDGNDMDALRVALDALVLP